MRAGWLALCRLDWEPCVPKRWAREKVRFIYHRIFLGEGNLASLIFVRVWFWVWVYVRLIPYYFRNFNFTRAHLKPHSLLDHRITFLFHRNLPSKILLPGHKTGPLRITGWCSAKFNPVSSRKKLPIWGDTNAWHDHCCRTMPENLAWKFA